MKPTNNLPIAIRKQQAHYVASLARNKSMDPPWMWRIEWESFVNINTLKRFIIADSMSCNEVRWCVNVYSFCNIITVVLLSHSLLVIQYFQVTSQCKKTPGVDQNPHPRFLWVLYYIKFIHRAKSYLWCIEELDVTFVAKTTFLLKNVLIWLEKRFQNVFTRGTNIMTSSSAIRHIFSAIFTFEFWAHRYFSIFYYQENERRSDSLPNM